MSSPDTPKTPPADFVQAAEAGDAEAQCTLGRWYAENLPETPYAQMWFRRAADQGLPRAQHNLGVLAASADDMPLAAEWFKKAVVAGWPSSFGALAFLLEKSGNIAGASHVYQLGADRGYANCQDALGRLAFDEDTKASYETARYWSEKAAAQGEADSQTRLGTIYHEGLGVERSPEQAAAWFLKAAQQGHAGAQLMIGGAYHLGVGVKVNRLAAMRFLTASAAQGNEFAQAYLPDVEADLTPEERSQLESEKISARH